MFPPLRTAHLLRRPASTWLSLAEQPCSLRRFSLARHSTISHRRNLVSAAGLNGQGKSVPKSTTLDSTTVQTIGTPHSASVPRGPVAYTKEYQGPLTPTFRRLKIFSIVSLGLSAALSPIMFVIESALPMTARAALAGIAISTSGISTLLVSWCGSTYVTALRHLRPSDNDGIEGLEMTTLSLMLRKRITRVYDVDFLMQTTRPFAKWELAETVSFPKKGGEPGEEETVAEMLMADGEVIGRWIVKWEENGVGKCRKVGNIIRHFNVHEELLT